VHVRLAAGACEGLALERHDAQVVGEPAAAEHGIERISTDTDGCMTADDIDIYFDAQATSRRFTALSTAIKAGKHIFTEKPTAETLEQAIELARLAKAEGIIDGVVHDKLYLAGLVKLRQLIDEGFFGRILSMRGEFGYWVWEGTDVPAQRPSWNYRAEDGGGITIDMYPHWNYVIEGLLGTIDTVYSQAATHIGERIDEGGKAYKATADDAAYGIFQVTSPQGDPILVQLNSSWDVRVHRGELVEFQIDGTKGSAVAGLRGCVTQARTDTPTPTWNPDLPDPNDYMSQWVDATDTDMENGFKLQWEEFIRDVAAGRKHRYDLLSGARGVQLAELGLKSSCEGRRLDVPEIVL
jgi:predicted dehydrogenase